MERRQRAGAPVGGVSILDFTVPPWYADAACRTANPEDFYPQKGNPARAAVNCCRACPVQTLCLEDAIDRGEPHGIWGGLTERQRRRFIAGDGRRDAERAKATAELGRLGVLGVAAADVREWAFGQGLTDRLAVAGRLPKRLLDAYEEAHPIEESA